MKYFIKYINKYIVLFLIAVVFLILGALCDLLQPSIMAKIIDVGINNKDINYILSTGVIMIGITCLVGIFSIIRSILSTKVSQNFAYDLRNDIYINFKRDNNSRYNS